uniref:Uncharacterized protein n=1 Tax=Alexandrium catenella TaxID=2925 RepID=A0A7S1WP90_ALECA|mmetsp:Transcript_78310/g.207854  ORF Transcript_78310/g.207854 Transcript_78310/m.207854 type:complete len:217 (+) Transcript_78310:105-755(+)
MLQLYKNEAITSVTREQLEIRKMELDWYTTNYDTMALQAAMFAGFAFEQVTEPVPEGTDTVLEVVYVILTCTTLGFELCVCMSCTFCCIFGKGLALRGPHGARSVHDAVNNLEKEQKLVFTQFLLGILGYLISNIMKMWIYFRPRIALTVSLPLSVFFLAIVYYVLYIVDSLVLEEGRSLTGQISAWAKYEKIQDLDEALHRTEMEPLQTPRRGNY